MTTVAACFGYTPPCQKLAVSPPPAKLLSFASLLSVVGQLLIVFVFQVSFQCE